MINKGYFHIKNNCLTPSNYIAVEMVRKAAKKRDDVLVQIHTPRNPKHHAMFFALLQEVIDAGGWEGSLNTLRTWVKIATGHCDTFIGPDGNPAYAVKSMSYAAMDQNAFNVFFAEAIKQLCAKLLSGANEDALRERILEQVDGGYSSLERQRT